MDIPESALALHKQHHGKIEVISKVPLKSRDDLSLAYTPGVAEPCREIAKDKEKVYTYTAKGNMVAVVSDGSAVLGLGNIGPEAALPVMEGKAILFKAFAGLDAFPLCLKTQDTEEIIQIVKSLEPTFGGINLEDISAPRCFEIEGRLKNEMTIPVFHDDQHGTSVVVLAGLFTALPLAGKKIESVKIVISGAGAAGICIAKLLLRAGAKNIVLCDSKGSIGSKRQDLNDSKKEILFLTNPRDENASLPDVLKGADVFIGVSAAGLLRAEHIRTMGQKPIVFAMANPIPEIMPDEARAGGAFIIATGRSDFPNQLNNVLAFPGILKGAMKARKQVTEDMKIAAARALASLVKNPVPDKIIPSVFEEGVADTIAKAIYEKA